MTVKLRPADRLGLETLADQSAFVSIPADIRRFAGPDAQWQRRWKSAA